jgi:hypothetical protein
MFKSLCRLAVVFAFTISQAYACNLVDKRVCDIGAKLEAETGHKVQYVADFSARIAAVEWAIGQPDIVHLGDTLTLGDDELFFVLAHEFGHSVMRHGRKFVESFGPESAKSDTDLELLQKYGAAAREGTGSQELNHSHEYAADAFAAKLMAKYGMDYVKAMKGFLKPDPSTITHPSRRSRIDKVKQVVSE